MLVPQPPLDMMVDKAVELPIMLVLASIAAGGVLVALMHWARTRRPVMLLLFGAGTAMMVFEPLVDTVGGCWFPTNSYIAFEAYGRPMPVWLCLAYSFYFGIASAAIWMLLRRGLTRGQVQMAFVGLMIGDLAFESVLLIWKPYAYYGHQPLLLDNGFALWWAPVNALVPIVLGAIVYAFDDWFRGVRALAIVPIGLMTSAAVNASVGWPSWMAVNTDLGWIATQACGVTTFVLAAAVVRVVAHFVARAAAAPVTAGAARPLSA